MCYAKIRKVDSKVLVQQPGYYDTEEICLIESEPRYDWGCKDETIFAHTAGKVWCYGYICEHM